MTEDPTTLWAFSEGQVLALTGLTQRQLRHWSQTGFFAPSFGGSNDFGLYSFRDLVGLRTIAKLREHVRLQDLRRLGAWLRERYETPWSTLTFYRDGKEVQVDDPDSGQRLTADQQVGMQAYPMAKIAAEAKRDVLRSRKRSKKSVGRVDHVRGILGGAPIVAGTRITTARIRELTEQGATADDLVRQFPALTKRDVAAALRAERSRRSAA